MIDLKGYSTFMVFMFCAFLLYVAYIHDKADADKMTECRIRGGSVITIEGDWKCVDKKSLIEVKP